ncbi:lipopolysaccharide biosynthesis protein [Fibrobacter sp. UWB16]|uniref:lipopolysaccharide biosynthesis protein n=2 Tax=unclassified Fibrobacter TaxID=2634177 RepID=UPI001357EBFB|nr:MATE family efflux transporter [Fibrobacter sp. UWB16]
MIAAVAAFVVGFFINFFLTPYIVKSLGTEAYGFIGLTTNIISYTGLISIALNSMAGRFITIEYCKNKIDSANKYYTSVFFSNIILSLIIALLSLFFIIWMESIVSIPQTLIFEVKMLFALLALNNIFNLISNTWGVSLFVKNRLDLGNIRNILGTVINASTIVLCFSFFNIHLWYIGLAGFLLAAYTAITNFRFAASLTPDLHIKKSYFDFGKIKELLKSGVWNLIAKLGDILGQGLDLLIANLFIGTIEMGMFAITKNIPFLILGLFQTISGVFAPVFTKLYAQNKKDNLLKEIHKSIRFLSFFAVVPLVFLYIYGDCFFKLWLPTEDSSKLIRLTILGTFALPYTLPLESLWNIFTVTNKIKVPTIFTVANNLLVFAIVMVSMCFFESPEKRLFILAGTRSICGIIRGFLFLPIYGAQCLEISKKSFFKDIFKSLFCLALCLLAGYGIRHIVVPNSWIELFIATTAICIPCFIFSFIIILTKEDRQLILKKFFN